MSEQNYSESHDTELIEKLFAANDQESTELEADGWKLAQEAKNSEGGGVCLPNFSKKARDEKKKPIPEGAVRTVLQIINKLPGWGSETWYEKPGEHRKEGYKTFVQKVEKGMWVDIKKTGS
ncbi:MAG: hypothetical protein UX09_C0011G0016 [Candidatus Uhrbacteria bacterium GW2011_GWE2_45_35]|uniref:Uncharacterized protein n=2 Tax=Candidatus Uhriibacteriota TaxID=1752732 RepID=A0A0G1JKB8_9BACT|nr:MAG: hypothetical protein UW63_C0007G0005 [Candidatus Uhrbacteria bacterium GW2011_GWF2_44_350]KKU08834.1 MAG: hypothetical protein UX09_C0011G0016 [Candidatus Uhrbacteria bacterium GW2011_GWE2_45_35]HBR80855.1 hypothetical protein [Candidatus Uhrbacteria bacterium]HCU32161.1 hypothetical protein [Candidatus Uhrbacteria bacterium]